MMVHITIDVIAAHAVIMNYRQSCTACGLEASITVDVEFGLSFCDVEFHIGPKVVSALQTPPPPPDDAQAQCKCHNGQSSSVNTHVISTVFRSIS